MRLSPSVLAPAWRQQDPASVAAGERWIVDGHVIPPGTQVGVSNYALQHDAKIFPEPFAFKPERWLPPPSSSSSSSSGEADAAFQAQLSKMRRAFAPFSVGERACAGKPMAWLEMSLVVAKTVWYFDFEKAEGEAGKVGEGKRGWGDGREREGEFQLYEGVVVGHDGPNVVFRPRGEEWRELEEKGK